MSTIVYITKGEVAEVEGVQADMFDGMLEAQSELGQVTWDCLSHNVAVGFIGPAGGREDIRIAVFNLDNADGMDVIRVTNYVNGHSDEMPELRY